MFSCRPTGFVAGTNHVTIADIAMAATFTQLQATDLVDMSPYPELMPWLDRIKVAVPNYQKACGEGMQKFGDFFKQKLAEAKAN